MRPYWFNLAYQKLSIRLDKLHMRIVYYQNFLFNSLLGFLFFPSEYMLQNEYFGNEIKIHIDYFCFQNTSTDAGEKLFL